MAKKPFIVGISGPICSGKSALGALMGRQRSAIFVPEPDARALLTRMQTDGSIKAVEIQEWIVRERHRLVRDAISRATGEQFVLLDRLLLEDKEVFFRFHHRIGTIDQSSLAYLEELVEVLRSDCVEPALTIFLTADRSTLRERLSRRPEGAWLLEHLDLHLTLYDEYWRQLEGSGQSRIRIDTSGHGPEALPEQSRRCWGLICEARSLQRARRSLLASVARMERQRNPG